MKITMKKVSKGVETGVNFDQKMYQFIDVSKLKTPSWVENRRGALKRIFDRPKLAEHVAVSVDHWRDHNETLLDDAITRIEKKAAALLEFCKESEAEHIQAAMGVRIAFLKIEAKHLSEFADSFKEKETDLAAAAEERNKAAEAAL